MNEPDQDFFDAVEDAYKRGLNEGAKKQVQYDPDHGLCLEESMYTVYRREDLYDSDYGDCTRLHCGDFVIDLYFRSGNRELAETSIAIFKTETVEGDPTLQYERG